MAPLGRVSRWWTWGVAQALCALRGRSWCVAAVLERYPLRLGRTMASGAVVCHLGVRDSA